MNKGDISKFVQCWSDFIHSMKGAVLEEELLKFQIVTLRSGYKINISSEVALALSKLLPTQWVKKHTDRQDLIKEIQKTVKIRNDNLEVEDECALFIALSLYIKAIKKIKGERISAGKKEIEEKLPEVIPHKIYNAVKSHIWVYYSRGNFGIRICTLKIKTAVPVPRIKVTLKSTKPKELIEEVRQLFRSVSPK